MVFSKRPIVALLAMLWLTPAVQAADGSITPGTLPVVTVSKSASAESDPADKLVVTGATLGEVDKPVVRPGQKPPSEPGSTAKASPIPAAGPVFAPQASPPQAAPSPVRVGVVAQETAPAKIKAAKTKPASAGSAKPGVHETSVEKRGYYDSVQLIPVSDRDYNRIVFPEPIVKGRMPAGTKLSEELVYLSGNRAMMFQLAPGQSKVIQMVVELASGRVETLYLKPQAVPGTVHRVDGALDSLPVQKKGRHLEPVASASSPHAFAVAILKSFVRGEIPASFEAVEPPIMTRFDKFSVVPAGAWADGSDYKVYAFQLIAAKGQSAVVSPSQFYREGVRSVMVDGDEVSEESSPFVYVVEDLNHDD